MRVRAQQAMVFHLDKCVGCHTCSLACKALWTDRRGAEYMWWNNVETKPGTGYPTGYENQESYRGGWRRGSGPSARLRQGGRVRELADIFYNPQLPALDDYYEPWSYQYQDLLNAPAGEDQPVARPVSAVDGRELSVEAGPNWDDDLGGSSLYAANDPDLVDLNPEERAQLLSLGRLCFFHLPRICNHCLNPGCLAACPAGAIYKRGEDGIVLVGQDKCRGWRMCVSGCPYKKTYFNWETGKSEKCILCYPRQEDQQVPGCMHVCVGRIRYLGPLLYDADRIEETANRPDAELVEAQRELILDPHDPQVMKRAAEDGVADWMLHSAQHSPVFLFVKRWRLALPHRPDFRTLPSLFYVPPLLPVLGESRDGVHELAADLFSSLESARLPMRYLSRLLAGGNEKPVLAAYRKLMAGRLYFRRETVGDVDEAQVRHALEEAGTDPAELQAIYQLTALGGFKDRFVVPALRREEIDEPGEPSDVPVQGGPMARRPAPVKGV